MSPIVAWSLTAILEAPVLALLRRIDPLEALGLSLLVNLATHPPAFLARTRFGAPLAVIEVVVIAVEIVLLGALTTYGRRTVVVVASANVVAAAAGFLV